MKVINLLQFLLIALIVIIAWGYIFGDCGCDKYSDSPETFGGSDWNTTVWGAQPWNGWPY